MASRNRLPSSVPSVFCPSSPSAADNLKNATLFTRIHIRATPQAVKDALNSAPQIQNSFALGHLSDILIYDNISKQHITHVKAVLEMMTGKGIEADIELCALEKPSWTEAGFYISPIRIGDQQTFMIVLREHFTPDALAVIDREL